MSETPSTPETSPRVETIYNRDEDPNKTGPKLFNFRPQAKDKVLSPEHPALEKFQIALRETLLRQIGHLKDEIFEFETGAKKKNLEREELGVETYEAQQVVCKQQSALEHIVNELKTVTAAREEVELDLQDKKKLYKIEMNKLMDAAREEKELRNDLEATNLMIQQMSQWENTMESEITVNKRIAEKTRKEKIKLAEEKRHQDLLLYKLQTEVWKLEAELETMEMQLRVKSQEQEELAQAVAKGNTNIEALETEYRCLMHSWDSVIVAIGNRDKILNCVSTEINKSFEKYKSKLCEVDQLKKLSKKEMIENENLTAFKHRINSDIQATKTKCEEEQSKQHHLEKKITNMEDIIEQTEKDIKNVINNTNEKLATLKVIMKEYDKFNLKKATIESAIVAELEDKLTNTTASKNYAGEYRRQKQITHNMDIALAEIHNKHALILTEYETRKTENAETMEFLRDLNRQQEELQKEEKDYLDKLSKFEYLIHKRQRDTDMLNAKLYTLQNVASQGKDVSPETLKIKSLEKNIEETHEKIKYLQQFWLGEQRNLLDVSKKRQEQITNNNLIKKQILILEQKNLKINDDLEVLRKQDHKTSQGVHNLQNRITTICDSLSKQKCLKQNLDKSNDIHQAEYISKLKDAELEILKIQADIADIEEDKINLSQQLVENNREALEWEKKLQLVKETKSNIDCEKGTSGDIGQMRAEIHRMNVRYAQLKKAQDKLIHDLEHCVSRRDAIVTLSEAREKRIKNGAEKTRFNFNRKLDDMRNRITQSENDVERVQQEIQKLETEKAAYAKHIKDIQTDVSRIQKETVDLFTDFENAKTNRQMNLELLLLKQKRLNLYVQLTKGIKPFLAIKSDNQMSMEFDRQMEMNGKLITITDNLITDFPTHYHVLQRILNLLHLPRLASYTS